MPRTSPSQKHYPELSASAERRRAALKPATPCELPPGPDDSHRGDDAPQVEYELQDR